MFFWFDDQASQWAQWGSKLTDPNGWFWRAAKMFNDEFNREGSPLVVSTGGAIQLTGADGRFTHTTEDDRVLRLDINNLMGKGIVDDQAIATILAHELEHAFGGVHHEWVRRSEIRPGRRSESDPPEGRSFYAP